MLLHPPVRAICLTRVRHGNIRSRNRRQGRRLILDADSECAICPAMSVAAKDG
jgi:hypothetical protein